MSSRASRSPRTSASHRVVRSRTHPVSRDIVPSFSSDRDRRRDLASLPGQHRGSFVMGSGGTHLGDFVGLLRGAARCGGWAKTHAASLGADRSLVALAASLIWLGTGLGGIMMGWIADRLGMRPIA